MDVRYNSAEYFRQPQLATSGFREYDARWTIEPNGDDQVVGINYIGLRELGRNLAHFFTAELDAGERVIVGHDFRKYSENAKNALVLGLLHGGMSVIDIGLALTPTSYFAQFYFDVPCVAMVTASHNDNGWTGVKMGHRLASTFGPDEMAAFKAHVEHGAAPTSGRTGSYIFTPDVADAYINDLVQRWKGRFQGAPLPSVAVETGNGTAGSFLPNLLRRLGFTVVEGNTQLDWDFPNFNPNPESIPFLRSVESLVNNTSAEVGICIDGDGDRLGVVDDEGRLVFADRVGLLIAKFLESEFGSDRPVVIDVKSTSLFESELTSEVVWAKTGHSYVKAEVESSNALAGFERSGHFFFREPVGRGYDDACVASLALLWVLCSSKRSTPSTKLSGLLAAQPQSFSSPNRQPYVADADKYEAVSLIADVLKKRVEISGRRIIEWNTLNGIRVTLDDRSWFLIRASSNSPNLVIIAEVFDEHGELLREIDEQIRDVITESGAKVGEFEPLHEY